MSDEFVDWDADQLVRAAEDELNAGVAGGTGAADWKPAVELLRRALTVDEDHARAHAMLALALLVPGRLAGAEAEATRALALDGGSPYCHHAMAAVLYAQHRIEEAWSSCHVALGGGLDRETTIASHVLGAKIREARGEIEPARELIDRALALADRVTTRVAAARLELAAGRLDVAARHAGEALRRSGIDVAANVIAGEIDLRAGDLAAATRHAQFALIQDQLDREALALWAKIKARQNAATGSGWRALVWIATRDDQQQTGLLVGSFLFVQLLMILANAAGWPGLQGKLVWIWLGFLIGLYWGPVGLHKLLSRELGTPDRSV